MNDFIYSEKFDKYLKGKLEESEKSSLENTFKNDPLLNHEVSLQKDIYTALSNERRLLIKSRLDEVSVNTGYWLNLSGLQWAAIVSSLLLFSAGSYYYFDSALTDEFSSISIDISKDKSTPAMNEENDLPNMPVPEYVEVAPDDESLSASLEEISGSKIKKSQQPTSASSESKGALPEITRPDVVSNFIEEDQQIDYSDFEAPDKTILEKSEASSAEVAVETIVGTDYNFHYKLIDQKLFLYGDFEGIPYKIIALNRDNQSTLFLEFKDNYYALKNEEEEITPLIEIGDPTIVKALKRLSK